MITVNNLTKIYHTQIKTHNMLKDVFFRQYKEKKALDSISFHIGDDEMVGFIGPNGAGKTTTLKILSGILFPTSGIINVLGYTPSDKNRQFLKQISFVMGHKNQLIWELPATDSYRLLKEIYEIDERDYEESLHELTELLHANDIINQPVKTLSLGQRMRAEIIASLLHRPKILFLDEPTIGLDIFAQTAIIEFIKAYQQRYKPTIILTSHYMQDVERLAKRILVIDHGKLLYDGKFKNLIEQYSQLKLINITLLNALPKKFILPGSIKKYDYSFPQLKLVTSKNEIVGTLSYIQKQIEYTDVTIEDEPIEEIIKKIFVQEKR